MNNSIEATFSSRTDDQLIQAINAGCVEEGLAVLQARYGDRVETFIKGIVRDSWLAQDVAQETFIKVFLKSHLYRLGTSFKAWVFEIARNQALSALRQRRRNPLPITSLDSGSGESGNEFDILDQLSRDDINRELEEAELMEAFHLAVAELPGRSSRMTCTSPGRSRPRRKRRRGRRRHSTSAF